MPIKVKSQTNGHNPAVEEMPPVIEDAEVLEDVYAEEAPQVRPNPEESAQPEGAILRSLIPDTEEDFEFGYRILRDREYNALNIPKDRSLYLTREDASKNIFKISAARLGEHLKELANFKFPPNYLWDASGLTPECIAELKVKIQYTSRKVYPSEDLRKFKRGELSKVGIENPKYPLRFKYWEQIAKRSEEFQNWLGTRQPQDDDEPEVHQAEWVFTENSEERDERHSQARSQIELSKLGFFSKLKAYFADIREEALRIAEDEGLETRLAMDKAHAQTIVNPEQLDEEEDL